MLASVFHTDAVAVKTTVDGKQAESEYFKW